MPLKNCLLITKIVIYIVGLMLSLAGLGIFVFCVSYFLIHAMADLNAIDITNVAQADGSISEMVEVTNRLLNQNV